MAGERVFPGAAPRVDTAFRASLLQIPLFGDDNLFFSVTNIHPTNTITGQLEGRAWSDERRDYHLFSRSMRVPPGTTVGDRIALERGALLTLRAFPFDFSGIAFGDVWFQVALVKGLQAALHGGGVLLQGYALPDSQLGWPGSPIQSLHEGKGVVRGITWSAGIGKALIVTVPSRRRWRVLSGSVGLATTGAAGARTVTLTVFGPVSAAYASEGSPTQGPLTVIRYGITPGISPTAIAPVATQPLGFAPDLELVAGMSIEVRVGGAVDPLDSLVGDSLIVREWFDPT